MTDKKQESVHTINTKALRDNFEKLKDKGFRAFSIIGKNNSKEKKFETLKDTYTKEDIAKWFTNPEEHEKEIRDFSRLLYVSKGMYNVAINYYTNLPTLDYLLIPSFYNMKAKNAILESKNEAHEYCEDILNNVTLRSVLKAVLKDAAYYGYERNGGGSFYLQRLPNDYCREGAIVNGLPSIEFDFSFFDKNEDRLELYEREFNTKYQAYLNNTNKEVDLQWQPLDYNKTICVPLESEDFNFPALTGIFDDLMELDDYYKYMKDATELETSEILIQTPPMDEKTGELLVEPDDFLFFQNAIAEILDEKFKIVSTPFKINHIDFKKGKSGDAGFDGVDKKKDSIWNGAGITKTVFGDADGSTGQKINLEINTAYVFSIVDKIELWANKRLKRVGNSEYPFKVKFLRTTNMYRKEMFDMHKNLLDIGGSIETLISCAGFNPEDYKRLLMLENLEGVKDLLVLPQSIYTQPGDSDNTGRPKSDTVDDAGDKTRDGDGNVDRD